MKPDPSLVWGLSLSLSVALGCGESSGSPSAQGGAAGGGAPEAGASGSSVVGGAGGAGDGAGASAGSLAGTSGAASGAGPGGAPQAGAGGNGASGTQTTELVIEPVELVFGSVQKVAAASQKLELHNPGSAAISLGKVALDAAASGTATFQIVDAPLPAELAGGDSIQLEVAFTPSGIGYFESKLLIDTGTTTQSAGLYGLGTKGLEGENEPFLQIVLKTLGYDVDVGGDGLLSTTTPLVGTEVAAPRFEAAAAGEIVMTPVARYSPEEPIPYGFYQGTSETEVGVISNDHYQALNPATELGSKPGFAAPAGDFGLFTTSKTHKTYTEDSKNADNATKHAVRTYPLKDRAGKRIEHSYLVCFEEAANGDYQDYVFTLTNVVPVVP